MLSYYDRLTSEQRSAYTAVGTALEQRSAYADARVAVGFDTAYLSVVFDRPLCCVAHSGVACDYDGRSYAFSYFDADEGAFNSRLDDVVSRVNAAQRRSGDFSIYGLYKAAYDVLATEIEYDTAVYRRYLEIANDGNTAEIARFLNAHGKAFSPYGALVEKKAVCNGIAKLYKAVCDRLGLECACVRARQRSTCGGNVTELTSDNTPCDHLLNVIEIDGVKAFVDLTNGLKTKDMPLVVYDYFAVNYSVLRKSFLLLPSDLAVFDCNGADNMYFERSRLVFPTLGGLRRYLAGYAFKYTDGEIRAYYSGTKLKDDDLREIAADVLRAHCPQTKWVDNVRCVNGFISCVIEDR